MTAKEGIKERIEAIAQESLDSFAVISIKAQNALADASCKPHHNRRFKPNKLFSRQLYVAASRPRHLLCIAMHTSRINEEQKQALAGLGWPIISLSQEGGAV